ncbi:MAG: miniconductance mechanosensitive channel [Paraglaciecola sp.]
MTENNLINDWLLQGFQYLGLNLSNDSVLFQLSALVLILLLAWISLRSVRFLLHGKITAVVLSSNNQLDDELHKHGFFRRCGHIIPAVLVYLLSPLLITEALLLAFLQKTAVIYVLIAAVAASSALLNTVEDLYNASHLAKRAPITGFVQVGKLFITIVAAVLIISSLLNKSPFILLSGLGAITAILLLLFRDTILGFVAGIQLAANRMVNTGDWIEMPQFGADGDVLEVGLTTVKVQNWDKTISTIPTYALITESVKNWRGMSESNGRRIKRSLHIDIQSIQFCDQDILDKLSNIRYIKEHLSKKRQELADYNQVQKIDNQDLLNSRRLSNIGILRAYLEAYLRHHPKINQDMTLMVRQRPPTELGLPLEIYCFCRDKDWVVYEGIQADIFDHALAMLPVFGLRAYQRVSDRQQAP